MDKVLNSHAFPESADLIDESLKGCVFFKHRKKLRNCSEERAVKLLD